MGKNHYGTTTGNTFRLSVCLKRFFSDERARCYIKADAGLRFCWLAARMRRLFQLTGPFCLVSRGHLLPPDETVGLLSPDDLVEVIPKHYKIFPDTSDSDESELPTLDDEVPRSSDSVPDIQPKQNAKGDLYKHKKILLETVNYQSRNSTPGNMCIERTAKQDDLPNTQNKSSNNLDVSIGKLEAENEKLEVLHDSQNAQNDNHKNTDAIDGQLEENIENIESLKRKALDLLDQFTFPVKRKRKRVRRRKQYTTSQEPEDTEDVTNKCEPLTTSDTRTTISPAEEEHAAGKNDIPERPFPSQHDDTIILRNNAEHGRTARIVHSL